MGLLVGFGCNNGSLSQREFRLGRTQGYSTSGITGFLD